MRSVSKRKKTGHIYNIITEPKTTQIARGDQTLLQREQRLRQVLRFLVLYLSLSTILAKYNLFMIIDLFRNLFLSLYLLICLHNLFNVWGFWVVFQSVHSYVYVCVCVFVCVCTGYMCLEGFLCLEFEVTYIRAVFARRLFRKFSLNETGKVQPAVT